MIEFRNKTRRKENRYLTFFIKPEEAAFAHGDLVFRPWMLIRKDGTSTRDPGLFSIDLTEREMTVKIKVTIADVDESLIVGIVKEGVAWFETLEIPLQ